MLFRSKGSEYTVTLEPHSGKWIFALDLPAPVSRRGITLGEGQVLEAQIPLRFRVRYTMAVAPGPDRSAPPGAWAVKLPGGNPRSRDLARQWAGKPAREAVGAFLRLLRHTPHETRIIGRCEFSAYCKLCDYLTRPPRSTRAAPPATTQHRLGLAGSWSGLLRARA